MTYHSRRYVRVVMIGVGLLTGGSFFFGPRTVAQEAAVSPAMKLAALNLKFDGAKSCGGKNCHDKAGDDSPPTERGHEFTIWNTDDKHRKAFDTLAEKPSADIGAKLKIADVKTSDRCIVCHALNVPDALHGNKFTIKEGNTCTQCHGPSEKWLEPHSEKGWLDKQRAASGSHDALLKQWGVYDTKPLAARAEICVSCHLAIDADLVSAGHPQPEFELDYFTLSEPKHWASDADGYFTAKIWLAGQIAAVDVATKQAAARKDDASAQQAKAHQEVLEAASKALGLGGMINVDNVNPDKKGTLAALNAIAALSLTKDAGKFGMDQQAYAIASLYNAYAKGEKVADAEKDAMNKLINDKLFPPDNGTLSVEQFEKNLPEVVAKLPK